VHYLRELVHRLRAGASQRAIAHDLGLARMTVQKYAQLAAAAGYLDASQPLPDAAELTRRLGPPPRPPRTPSSVEPYREQVEQLLADGVEMMTIFDRIRAHGYTGSYSSIRRFVRTLQPAKSTAFVRVHTAPGEEAQVDFGSAGTLLDPIGGRPRRAWIFVMTLSYSRHPTPSNPSPSAAMAPSCTSCHVAPNGSNNKSICTLQHPAASRPGETTAN